MEFRVCPPRRARRRNALQRGCPAPEWNSGAARSSPPRRARRRNALQRVCLYQAGDSIPSRGGLAEQRASARLPRPGMEFRVCQVKPAEAGSPNNALQRGCPAPEWNSGFARRGGLAELQRGLPVSDSIPSRGGLAEQRASARFACVSLGIPSPDSRPSPSPTAPANREASLASEVTHPRKTLLHAVWLPSQMVVGSDD